MRAENKKIIVKKVFQKSTFRGLSAIFVFNFSLLSCCVSLIATIVTSLIILNINKRYAS